MGRKTGKIYSRVYGALIRWERGEIGIQTLLWEVAETADRSVRCETHRGCLDEAMNDFFAKERRGAAMRESGMKARSVSVHGGMTEAIGDG